MIDSERIVRNVVNKFGDIGIGREVDGEPSHTAKLVRAIVEEIVTELTTAGEVRTTVQVSGPSMPAGSTEVHVGNGKGLPGSIS